MIETKAAAALNIVYVWDADYPWDVRTEKTCGALTEAGHNVHIIARNRKHSEPCEKLREGIVHRMKPWPYLGSALDEASGFPAFFNPRWRALVAHIAGSVHADLIIVRDLPLCPVAIAVARRLKIPVILDMAEHYPAMIQAIWDSGRQRPLDWLVRNPAAVELVERYCISRVNHIFTVADEMTERLVLLGVDRAHITCIGNTPDLRGRPRACNRISGQSEPVRLVYLGIMEIVRGVEDAINAVALLRDRGVETHLLLIGAGRDEARFMEYSARLGLTAENVSFAGFIPYAQALDLAAKADIGLLPLHRNAHMDTTVPNKLFDYMSLGLAVITSDTPPSARIVTAEDAGEVFTAEKAESLADAVVRLRDINVRKRQGENARAAVEREYNWTRTASVLAQTVDTVVREG